MKGTEGTAFPSHTCPHSPRSKAEPGEHWGGAHTLHSVMIRVIQCSESALGPHSPIPCSHCTVLSVHGALRHAGRGREAAAGRCPYICPQRETRRETPHGGEGPCAALHRCKTPWGLRPSGEGRTGTLTAAAFQELLRLQLPNVMKDFPSLEEQMRALDASADQELTFDEFWRLMGELAQALMKDREGRKK
ncbi:protein S100-A13 isoform X1 [Numida meleagris]|uniref:protein S100-A13 isoform X1 n=1 Tax=Numida meleagris TaxID=8996 RepID=UPI000B3E1357|nr:protein S100-A13 isoform X1 [Numida meleagris]